MYSGDKFQQRCNVVNFGTFLGGELFLENIKIWTLFLPVPGNESQITNYAKSSNLLLDTCTMSSRDYKTYQEITNDKNLDAAAKRKKVIKLFTYLKGK